MPTRFCTPCAGRRIRDATPSLIVINYGPFLEWLCKRVGLDAALPMNSGAEAVETAIKAARRWGQQAKGVADPEIIVAVGNFHGRTTTIISFSTEPDYREGFGPFTMGFRSVPFGDLKAASAAVTSKPSQFWSSQFRAKAASSSLLKDGSPGCGASATSGGCC